MVLDLLLVEWPPNNVYAMASDGAGNFTCTALLTSLARMFKSCGARLYRHAISEVGDGKDLTDTDFQQAQSSLDQAKAGGGSVTSAVEIVEALDAFPTQGTANAAVDLGQRSQEPKGKGSQPKPYSGIDSIYDRKFEYDEGGEFIGVRLRQFYGVGEGRFVPAAELRKLWVKEYVAAGELQPTMLKNPDAGAAAAAPKTKATPEAEQMAKGKERKSEEMAQRRALQELEELGAMKAREQRRWEAGDHVYKCKYASGGCSHRAFLQEWRAREHEESICSFRPEAVARQPFEAARLVIRVRPTPDAARYPLGIRARTFCRSLHQRGDDSLCSCTRAHVGAAAPTSEPAMLAIRTLRPLVRATEYGLQRFKPAVLSSEQAAASRAETAPPRAVQPVLVKLGVSGAVGGGTRVILRIGSVGGRLPPPLLERGWAIRPPVEHTRFSAERKALLTELFDKPDRVSEHQARSALPV